MLPAARGRSSSHAGLQCIAHAADLHDVSIGIVYFEYDLNDDITGAAGHGRTASYNEVSVQGILSALTGSVRHDISLSYSDLCFIAHATNVHDIRIGVGYFEFDLDDGIPSTAAHGLSVSFASVPAQACYE